MAENGLRMRHRHGRRTEPPAPAGYHGLPLLKASHWRWMVAFYIWLAGLAGAMQVLAALVLTQASDAGAVRSVLVPARYGAVVAAGIGTVLLIADLKTPRRFLHMLRIYRPTSPMSFGSYVLVVFSAVSALAALLQLLADLGVAAAPRPLELGVQWTAAAVGLLMLTYTGPLLSATSTPLWAQSPRLLAAGFAAFSMAAGASALVLWSLATGGPYGERLERVALLSLLAAWLCLILWLARLEAPRSKTRAAAGWAAPLLQGSAGAIMVFGVAGGGLVLPALMHLLQLYTAAPLAWASAVAAAGELAGSLLWRGALLLAGQDSARRTTDALRAAGWQADAAESLEEARRDPAGARRRARRPRWLIGGLSLGGLGTAVGVGLALAA